MGHKVHPKIHRTGIIYTWDSRWFSKDDYATYAEQDIAIRTYLGKKFKDAHIDRIRFGRCPKIYRTKDFENDSESEIECP